MDWIKGISPAIRILLIAIVLILLPAAALSYIGFLSVNERARNLETGYRGTLLLVRDRIERRYLVWSRISAPHSRMPLLNPAIGTPPESCYSSSSPGIPG